MNHRWRLLPLLAICLGCHRGETPVASREPAGGSVKVTAVSPWKMSLPRIVEQPGTIRAYEEAPLIARLTGYVRKIHVDIGMKVKGPRFDAKGVEIEPGQVLAEIDVPEMEEEAKLKQAQVRQAEAEIEQAKKSLATAEATVAVADAAIVEAKASVAKAQANLDRWDSESKRISGLVRTGVVDRQIKDETDNQLRAAGAGREEAAARVASSEALAHKSRSERDKSAADIRSAEARLEVCRADARRQEAMHCNSQKVRGFRSTGSSSGGASTPGICCNPGKGEPLFVVKPQQDRVRATVEVPESDAALVKDGAKATIVMPSVKGLVFEGKVSRTAWGLDNGSRTLRTEIDLDNTDGRLRPAMYVNARIAVALPETYVLPSSALVKQGETSICFRIEAGKVFPMLVQTGSTVGNLTQVLQAQKTDPSWSEFDGSEVIANPATNLASGQAVETKTDTPRP